MKLSEKSQVMLERYLLAVERRLPWQGRKDIIAEIRANFMDTLEDHYAPEETLDETALEEELRKLGSPGTVAAGYRQGDALIGPQHNQMFRLIVTILTPIVVAAVLFAGLLSLILSGGKSPFWSIWEMFGNAWQVAVGIIGTAAVIFMVLTRWFPQVNAGKALEGLNEEEKHWKVSDLPEVVAEPDKVHVWELALGLTFGVLELVFFLFLFDQLAGFWWYADGKWRMAPVFTEAFKAFIPWIAVNIGLGLVLNIVMFIRQRRSLFTRLFEIGIKASELALTAALLRAGTLISFDATTAIRQGFPPEAITGIQMLLQNDFVRWFLVFLVVVISIDLVSKLVQLVKSAIRQAK